ncbi:arsenate reductase [Halobellus clavatus]|jgi:hypothetical protein|uniref:Arsenate reductase n=2 Tax=Halobellus clavatus TaxID=660517 RepID=A0A1H3D097_9EURY|nr:arsenate reductase [Halobellus clavatus]
MREIGVERSEQEFQEVSTAELDECGVVATVGCSTFESEADVEIRGWVLKDPHTQESKKVCEIRDEREQLVTNPFDEYIGKRRAEDSQAMRPAGSEDGTSTG